MTAGWRLVADDRVRVWRSGDRLYGAPPPILAGLIEVRGLDVVRQGALPFARIRLLADAASPVPPERIPAPQVERLQRVALPRVEIALLQPCALARLDMALDAAAREAI